MDKDAFNSRGGGTTATLEPPTAAAPPERIGAPQTTLRQAVQSMVEPPAKPCAAHPRPLVPRTVRFGAWLNRSRRVLLAMAAVWVLATFDLGFTMFEADTTHFVELNPIAAGLLRSSPATLYAFKFCLLGLATLILLLLRKHALAEMASWFILATMVYVGMRWLRYYDCVVTDTMAPYLAPPW